MFNSGKTVGDLSDNLTLQTKGKIYIQFGKKFIELLNNKGELNVNFPKIIKNVDSLDKLSSGLYDYDGNLYCVVGNETRKISTEGVDTSDLKEGDILRYDGKNFEYYNIDDKFNEIIERLNNLEGNLN